MTPEHTDMTGAARLREALEDLSFAKDRIENDWSCHEDGCPRCEAHRRLSRAARGIREALAAVPEAPEAAHDCEAELKARPDYDQFRGTPAGFACSCGAQFVCCDDEAEGVCWERVEEGTER